MNVRKFFPALVLLFGAALTARPALSQTNCTATQEAAVECFVANAVATDLAKPRYGMTLAQFESYGVAVSQILRTHHTYIILVGISGAVAAANNFDLTTMPKDASLLDLQHFSLDVTDAMNGNDRFLELLSPGISLRIIDSYLVTATTNGAVNWTKVNTSLSAAINNFVKSGLMKVPPGMTLTDVTSFAYSLAQVIHNYKVETHRTALSAN
jgi:hypothetical protein